MNKEKNICIEATDYDQFSGSNVSSYDTGLNITNKVKNIDITVDNGKIVVYINDMKVVDIKKLSCGNINISL